MKGACVWRFALHEYLHTYIRTHRYGCVLISAVLFERSAASACIVIAFWCMQLGVCPLQSLFSWAERCEAFRGVHWVFLSLYFAWHFRFYLLHCKIVHIFYIPLKWILRCDKVLINNFLVAKLRKLLYAYTIFCIHQSVIKKKKIWNPWTKFYPEGGGPLILVYHFEHVLNRGYFL